MNAALTRAARSIMIASAEMKLRCAQGERLPFYRAAREFDAAVDAALSLWSESDICQAMSEVRQGRVK